ncbi:MAG: zinc ribbon domain-containing protein [bacterium]|nr:zinc ribbon domain-containing protein [bacterium]
MPTYEYRCGKCRRAFTARLSMSEHDRRKPACPKCGSRKVAQQLASFFPVTSKKS